MLNANAKLYYDVLFDQREQYLPGRVDNEKETIAPASLLILNSTKLYSFRGLIDYGGYENQQDGLRLVFEILRTCPTSEN